MDARTGAVLARITITTDPSGYDELLEWAGDRSGLRAWALEGGSGYGAGGSQEVYRGKPGGSLPSPGWEIVCWSPGCGLVLAASSVYP